MKKFIKKICAVLSTAIVISSVSSYESIGAWEQMVGEIRPNTGYQSSYRIKNYPVVIGYLQGFYYFCLKICNMSQCARKLFFTRIAWGTITKLRCPICSQSDFVFRNLASIVPATYSLKITARILITNCSFADPG